MIYRDSLVGAASQTAPTKGYEPPLKNVSVVVYLEEKKVSKVYTIIKLWVSMKSGNNCKYISTNKLGVFLNTHIHVNFKHLQVLWVFEWHPYAS